MRLPVKVVLPAARCVPTTLLTTRDIHNKAVIESMGMAWDACAPVWPYQACAGDGKFMTSPLWCAMLAIVLLRRWWNSTESPACAGPSDH
jgi:hypothetical protein